MSVKDAIVVGVEETVLIFVTVVVGILAVGFLVGGVFVGMGAIQVLTGAMMNGSFLEQIFLTFGALVGGSVAFGILQAVWYHITTRNL